MRFCTIDENSAQYIDGTLASLTFIDAVVASRPADPELQQMVQKQEQLVMQLDALKKKKATMKPEEYQPAWEALIIELATVSREVRSRLKGAGDR